MHFSLPGLMSLLSLIDQASTTLWRISFAIVAAGGVLARGPAPTGLGAAAYVAAPISACWRGPLRVEAVLLTMLVFLG